MKRQTAEKIVNATKQIDLIFGGLHLLTEEIDDEAEKKKMRRASAEIVLDVHEKITREVAKQFPDLHPDKG